jgi:hypothetical protein
LHRLLLLFHVTLKLNYSNPNVSSGKYLIKQSLLSNGSSYLYSPCVLWNEKVKKVIV